MTVRIYHNPRCSKSRQTLALLEEHGVKPEILLYLEHPPTADALKPILKKLGMSARDLMRKGESEYRELGLDDATLSEAALIKALSEHPKLIERPIVMNGSRAVIGRPPENILSIL